MMPSEVELIGDNEMICNRWAADSSINHVAGHSRFSGFVHALEIDRRNICLWRPSTQ